MPSPLPTAANDYKVYGDTPISVAVLGAVLSSIAARLNAAEAIRADFQALIDAGTGTALEAIQLNLTPKLEALDATIASMQAQFNALQEAYDQLTTNQIPASAVALATIAGVTANNVQAAIVELHAAVQAAALSIALLGNAAERDIGSAAGTVAAGDDPRFTGPVTDNRLPGRLGLQAAQTADWNLATANGWYMASLAINSPEAGKWFLGNVENHGAAGYCTQTVHDFTSAQAANTQTWRRHQLGGAWYPWYKLQISQTEQDARYARLIRSITAGSGLVGGGDLSADRSLELSAASLASLAKADSAVQPNDPSLPVAWANFGWVSSAILIRDAHGLTSITRTGMGKYAINFESPMANTNYVVVGSAGDPSAGGIPVFHNQSDETSTGCTVFVQGGTTTGMDAGKVRLVVMGRTA